MLVKSPGTVAADSVTGDAAIKREQGDEILL